MEEINRLHDIADDIGSTSWGYELASALHNIAAGIEEKVDEMRHVLDADDVPIKKGDTVWHKATGIKYRVFRFSAMENRVWGENDFGSFLLDCSMLTHTKPEPDTWERIEDDATLSPEVYCHRNGIDISQKDGTEIFLADTVGPMARDLVRRCREVAERERGE